MTDDDLTRETISIPDQIELPRLLDFYELQDPEHTQIHKFYENLREGELTTTQCTDCQTLHFPPRIICPECTSDNIEYVSLPHTGELHSFTEVRGTAAIGMNNDTPFVAGVVDLGEISLSARVDNVEYDDLEIGDSVQLKVIELDDSGDQDRVFYRFEAF